MMKWHLEKQVINQCFFSFIMMAAGQQGVNVMKLFTFVTDGEDREIRMLVSGEPFQHS
jgi:hypothetical protein